MSCRREPTIHTNVEQRLGRAAKDPGGGNFRRRLLLTGLWSAGFVLLVVILGIWTAVKAETIKRDLEAATQLVPELRDSFVDDRPEEAAAIVEKLRVHTTAARSAADDPVLRLATALPWLGPNFSAIAEIAHSADDVANLGLAPLVKASASLDWRSLLPPGGAGMDLGAVEKASLGVSAAAHAMQASTQRLSGIDASRLLPQVANPLREAREQLKAATDALVDAADVTRILPSMMGNDSPRSYLLLVQNNAELRATGGIPGALAVLNVDKGKLSLGAQSSASALGAFDPRVSVDPEQQQIYSTRMGRFMQDVNLTPDFPTAAQTAQAMWSERTGQELDGVLAIDPVALSYILDATGHVKIDDPQLREIAANGLPTQLTAKNVVPILLSDVYSEIPDPAMQDVYFAGVAKAVFSKISAGTGDTRKLMDGLTKGTSEGRILLWSRSSEEQSVIAKNSISGSTVGSSMSPSQFGVYFNDGTGAKMDYYVKRTVQLVEQCPNGEYGQVKIRITSTNTAPRDAATSLPEYVTGGGAFGVPAGTVQSNIVAYGPVQAHVEDALADGKKVSFNSQLHSGRPVGTVTVVLPPGRTSTVEFIFGRIVQHAEPKLAVTPTVQPLKDVVLGKISETCVPAP